ncbi:MULTISPECIES: SDR family NAD(P)-dependent oxidoreductase [unclassified Corynebacterium]|uniref:SDR family NAD(P)-dependent oxidoreductase n=1 Tax=unclassified Corynebacterium TaxID=2624378 RepID=UPI002168FBC2|nr:MULTISPECIES: SDR family NAD(P)-dependent oxidoreductase [unclassified Corynebacterium]MCS4489919.1 SDR family NAD(P)-dependent oxidoreductase [Corynebacterium sp. ES2775-CONJ]MCS4531823.1 SDR family NAD(P)-dependent oxidoreductase [Corynebacterium sp. ES2730-CONJ]
MKNRVQPIELPDQTGSTWLVTGATNGVGQEVARAARKAGARLIITARDRGRGLAAQRELDAIRLINLDLADLESIRAAAASVDEPIDVLINCAGVVTPKREETVDGFEMMMGTNFLGPFAFTNLIAGHVKRRVVIVGSEAHQKARLDLGDLQFTNGWWPLAAYSRSKLADMLWGLELSRRLGPVDITVAHPGWAMTNLQNAFSAPVNAAITAVSSLVAQSAADGAQSVLWAAVADIPSGSYVGPDGFGALRGNPTLIGRAALASDPYLSRKLWDSAVELTATDLPS